MSVSPAKTARARGTAMLSSFQVTEGILPISDGSTVAALCTDNINRGQALHAARCRLPRGNGKITCRGAQNPVRHGNCSAKATNFPSQFDEFTCLQDHADGDW